MDQFGLQIVLNRILRDFGIGRAGRHRFVGIDVSRADARFDDGFLRRWSGRGRRFAPREQNDDQHDDK